jgi:hypothetical protein
LHLERVDDNHLTTAGVTDPDGAVLQLWAVAHGLIALHTVGRTVLSTDAITAVLDTAVDDVLARVLAPDPTRPTPMRAVPVGPVCRSAIFDCDSTADRRDGRRAGVSVGRGMAWARSAGPVEPRPHPLAAGASPAVVKQCCSPTTR